MAIKKPIPITFNLDSHNSVQSVCAVIHIDDKNTETLDLSLMQGGEHIAVSHNSTVTARFVRVKNNALISDDVACTVQENGNIHIPIDNAAAHMLVGEIKIEVNIVDENDILTMQFPLVIRVNNTILADAEISPESEGTIPELLEEAREAAEDAAQAAEAATEAISTKQDKLTAGQNITITEENVISASRGSNDYTELENKPSINNVTLSGNKSSDDLSLQSKLTAGNNITINNGVISASGGVTSYEDLTDLPEVSNYAPSQQKQIHQLIGTLDLYPFTSSYNGSTKKNSLRLDVSNLFEALRAPYTIYNFEDLPTFHGAFVCEYANSGYFKPLPDFMKPQGNFFVVYNLCSSTGQQGLAQILFWKDKNSGEAKSAFRVSTGNFYSVSSWQEIGGGSQIVSGVVNVNGTITFTDSDGNTFTTSGESVIGADGFSPSATVQQTASGATVSITDKNGTTTANISNGQDGNDYVLTAQDKSDIADIVLSELPTTQGVLYGN